MRTNETNELLNELISALLAQAAAITALAQSNESLVQALEGTGEDEKSYPAYDLSGKPIVVR